MFIISSFFVFKIDLDDRSCIMYAVWILMTPLANNEKDRGKVKHSNYSVRFKYSLSQPLN